jgi:hypothetical protein
MCPDPDKETSLKISCPIKATELIDALELWPPPQADKLRQTMHVTKKRASFILHRETRPIQKKKMELKKPSSNHRTMLEHALIS